MGRLGLFIILAIPTFAFGDEAGIPLLEDIINLIPKGGTAIVVIAGILEFGLRLIKSEKPMSILLIVSGAVSQLSRLFAKLSELLDLVLPQRLSK